MAFIFPAVLLLIMAVALGPVVTAFLVPGGGR